MRGHKLNREVQASLALIEEQARAAEMILAERVHDVVALTLPQTEHSYEALAERTRSIA